MIELDRKEDPACFQFKAVFPAGARTAPKPSPRQDRKTLPAAVVKTDHRKEKQFSNRHIQDKRLGAASRAEMLRQQILRGSQEDTVQRGSAAFRTATAPGYSDLDDLQPEGTGRMAKTSARPGRPAEEPPSTSGDESSGESARKRRRQEEKEQSRKRQKAPANALAGE
eukprot:CAMPEP_0197636298 /NCGR_PEP_ID=MMETSP1338-20131121/11849_1 /TAXON_ID=43686 ORGANISM="Pelagodinium beii, Strain RCC1491" /NCGR_SAMPLE_ID=MMETSP1338 /ASSEMBLY_ACC=CAM_ASM_000754 /LENGTH=167 /DNA_ID=CAMNT_0043208505 /DNA_START=1 /DNA_END=502 /DNA_ORIENTATION=+